MKTGLFNLGFKFMNLAGAVSSTLDTDTATSSSAASVAGWFMNILSWLGNWIMTGIYMIIKFALNIVDFIQFFVQRLIGLDYWMDPSASLDSLGESDILFRFMFSPQVTKVFRLLIIVAIVLLIVTSIIAIVKSEYASAASGKDNSKKGIMKSALNAIFLVIIIPVMLLFGILASNAVLASLLNAISPGNQNLTMGGQIFVASAYGANRYRDYANGKERNPATFSYTMAYNYASNGTYEYFIVFDPSGPLAGSNSQDKFYAYEIVDNKTIAELNEADLNNAISTLATLATPIKLSKDKDSNTKYHTISSVFEMITPSDYNWGNELYGFLYGFNNSLKTYIAKFSKDSVADKLATYFYLTKCLGARVLTGNLGKMTTFDLDVVDTIGNASNILDGIANSIDEFFLGLFSDPNTEKWSSSGILLDSCAQHHILIQSAYNTWNFAKRYQDKSASFESSVSQNVINWVAQSGVTYANAIQFVNNKDVWSMCDGGANGMAPIPEEYEIMADFIDFAVSQGIEVHIVNSQSPLIDWGKVNQNNYVINDGKDGRNDNGLVEFCNNYKGVGNVVYKPTNTEREDQGAVYLMCLWDSASSKYIPIKPNTEYVQGAGNSFMFTSNYYGSEDGLIIARGIFDDWHYGKNAPTIITEKYTDENGKEIVSGAPTFVNFAEGATKINTLQQKGNFAVAINGNLGGVITNTKNGANGSGVVEYTINSRNLLTSDFWASINPNDPNDPNFAIFRDNVFRASPRGDFTYGTASESRVDAVEYNGEKVVVSLSDNKGLSHTFTLKLASIGSNPSFLVQMTKGGKYDLPNGLSSASYLQRTNNYIVDSLGTPYLHDGIPILAEDYFNPNNDYSEDVKNANEVYTIYSLTNDFMFDASTILGQLDFGSVGTTQLISQDNGVAQTRVWKNSDKTGDVFDIYIYNNKITIIPYQHYDLTIESLASTNIIKQQDVSGLDLMQVDGSDANGNAYINYGGNTFALKAGETSEGVKYYYIADDLTKTDYTETEYVANFYDGFAYKDDSGIIQSLKSKANDGALGGAISGGVSTASKNIPSVATVKFNLNGGKSSANSVIRALDGTILYGLDIVTNNNGYRTAYVYSGGQLVFKLTMFDSGDLNSMGDIIKSQNSTVNDGSNKSYVSGVARNGIEYRPVPVYSDDVIAKGTRLKPAAIEFIQQDIKNTFLGLKFDVNFVLGSMRFKIGLGNYSAKQETVSHLTNSKFYLDYNFNTKNGMGISTLYAPVNINPIILIFATVLVFKILMQSAWGLVKRIYDVTILFMVMPGFAGILPLDGGTRFGKWKEKLIKSIFSAYGVMLGINIFFVLVPVIKSATGNIFTYADLPKTIQNNFLFSRPDFLNQLVTLMFTLVALTLLQTLSGFISGLLEFDDVYKDGGDVKKNVDKMVGEVGDYVSGKKLVDNFSPTAIKGKLGKLADFIPGSAIAKAAWKADPFKKIREGLKAKEPEEKETPPPPPQTPTNTPSSPLNPTATSADTSSQANWAATSNSAATARGLVESDDTNFKEFTGKNGMAMPTDDGHNDDRIAKNENSMAAFMQEYETAEQNGDTARMIKAAADYNNENESWVNNTLNKTMLDGGGMIDVNEKGLDQINNNLADGWVARAYKSDEKDAFGNNMWTVEIAKKSDELNRVDALIEKRNEVETHLTQNIAGYNSDINRLNNENANHNSIISRIDERMNKLDAQANDVNTDVDTRNKCLEQMVELNSRRNDLTKQISDNNLALSDIQAKKTTAEANLQKVQDSRTELQERRKTECNKIYYNEMNNSAAGYKKATQQSSHLQRLDTAINSGKLQPNEVDKAVDLYVNTYHKDASDAEKAKIAADIKTDAGRAKAKKTADTQARQYEVIANGATARVNKVNGTNIKSPIPPKDPNGGGKPPTGGGGGNGGGGNPPPPTPPTSSNSNSAKPKGVVNKVKRFASTATQKIKDTATYVKETVTKERTVGDDLQSLYKKRESALAKGKTKKANRYGKKMVKVAGRGEVIRQKAAVARDTSIDVADNEYVEMVNKKFGTNVKDYKTAKKMVDQHTQKSGSDKDIDFIEKRHSDAINNANKSYDKEVERSSANNTRHSSHQQNQANVIGVTRQYAQAELQKENEKFVRRVNTAGKNVFVKAGTMLGRKMAGKKANASDLGKAARTANNTATTDNQYDDIKNAQDKYKNSSTAKAIRSMNFDDPNKPPKP